MFVIHQLLVSHHATFKCFATRGHGIFFAMFEAKLFYLQAGKVWWACFFHPIKFISHIGVVVVVVVVIFVIDLGGLAVRIHAKKKNMKVFFGLEYLGSFFGGIISIRFLFSSFCFHLSGQNANECILARKMKTEVKVWSQFSTLSGPNLVCKLCASRGLRTKINEHERSPITKIMVRLKCLLTITWLGHMLGSVNIFIMQHFLNLYTICAWRTTFPNSWKFTLRFIQYTDEFFW